jgi:hypothetical protein
LTSSIEYNKAKEGNAIKTRIKAGTIVQNISRGVECVNLSE